MVKTCCATNCRNRSKKPGISFFCFPKALHLRREWIRRVNKANFQPTRHTVLCSEHFPSDSFLSESVPEFLQLIGLEQRPIRRRLRHGAVPILFKRTSYGWEEGFGERGPEEKTELQEEDAKKSKGEMEEDSDDEGRFVIQMDVAEEEQDLQLEDTGKNQQSLSAPYSDRPTDSLSVASSIRSSDDKDDTEDKESSALRDDNNDRSSRPRRRCRSRAASRDGAKRGRFVTQSSDGPAEDDGRLETTAPDGGLDDELDDAGDVGASEVEGSEAKKDDNDGKSGEETLLCTIESVRTLNEGEDVDSPDGGEDEEDSSAGSSGESGASPPLAKKHKASSKESSPKSAGGEPAPFLSDPKSRTPGQLLYRIDPAFYNYHPVFEVPFASSTTFFSSTADSMVVSNAMTNNTASTTNTAADSATSKSAPPQVSQPGSATDHEDQVSPSAVRVITTPGSAPSSVVTSPVCTLPCCSGKAIGAAAPVKAVRVKQEAADAEDCALPSLTSEQPLATAELRCSAPTVSRPSPADVPYRSHPINVQRSTEARSMVPYRSEPLRKLPVPPTSRPTLVDYRDKAKRDLTPDLARQKQERVGRIKTYSAHGRPLGQQTGSKVGENNKGAEEKSVHGQRSYLAKQLLSTKSRPAFGSLISKVDALTSHRLLSMHKTSSPPNPNAEAAESGCGVDPGSCAGPFFIRRDHILADLLDVFKHSADGIQRDSIFRLCHSVTASSSPGPARPASLTDNWENVTHKRLFSLFWKECMKVYFDGDEQKVPRIDNQNASSDVPHILGKVLRHGLVLCGYWPVALSPACAVSVFSGEKCSPQLFLQSLRKTMFVYEAQALEELRESAREESGHKFREMRGEQRMVIVLQAYGGAHCQVPAKPEEVEAFVTELAAYYLYCQPFWWLREMRRGFLTVTEPTRQDQDYLTSMTEREVVNMYVTLDPTPQALLRRTVFRLEDGKRVSQNRVKGFLERCLLRLSRQELVQLLELWSQADCLLDDAYYVAFSASTSVSPNSKSPPIFRPAHNTLVLSQCTPTFHLFQLMLRKVLEDTPVQN